jgi:hypothetical protein
VVLVDHDVEPDLVAQPELVEIAVEKLVPDLRVGIGISAKIGANRHWISVESGR